MEMRLKSPAFPNGGAIPSRFSCHGANVSPHLEWEGVPDATRTLALICDDPDAPAGTWVHWVIFNIPAAACMLPEAVPAQKSLPDGSRQGVNDFGKIGYGGPCPPGGTHRYFFKLYALDAELTLPAGARMEQLLSAMAGRILADCQMLGTYGR